MLHGHIAEVNIGLGRIPNCTKRVSRSEGRSLRVSCKMALYHIFVDESCTDGNHGRMVFGGIILSSDAYTSVDEKLEAWRQRHGMHKELKWTKVKYRKLREYRDFAETGIYCARQGLLRFKSMVVKKEEIDYKTFHNNDKELGFYKLMYQFLLHSFGSHLKRGDRVLIHLDERVSKYPLSRLHMFLNRGMRRKHQLIDPVASIQPIDSKKSNVLQLTDVLMGAVAFHWNERHIGVEEVTPKMSLAEGIAHYCGFGETLQIETPSWSDGFGIWLFKFGAKKKRPES